MDPLTHALVGAVVTRAVVADRGDASPSARTLLLAGAFGALLPDVDRVIHSAADPLLHIEFHRHFTHALAFIPIGGLTAMLPWMLAQGLRPHWKVLLGAATLGYASHGLLDASTTYGTLLLWPFSDRRLAWNLISIVDPLFTGMLLLGLLVGWMRPHRRPSALVALAACVTYLAIGAWQRERAADVQQQLARARGHTVERAAVFPGFANQLVWRSLYEAGGTIYLDRIRVPWMGDATWSPGTSAALLSGTGPADGAMSPRLRRDLGRFQWFADDWVARSAADPSVVGDARYSLSPHRFEPVWGIRFTPGLEPPVQWVDHSRGRRVDLSVWIDEVSGRDAAFRALPRNQTSPR